MKLHDNLFFKKLTENLIMWAILLFLALFLIAVLFLPLYLAIRHSLWWLALYLVHFSFLVVAGSLSLEDKNNRGGRDEDN